MREKKYWQVVRTFQDEHTNMKVDVSMLDVSPPRYTFKLYTERPDIKNDPTGERTYEDKFIRCPEYNADQVVLGEGEEGEKTPEEPSLVYVTRMIAITLIASACDYIQQELDDYEAERRMRERQDTTTVSMGSGVLSKSSLANLEQAAATVKKGKLARRKERQERKKQARKKKKQKQE